MSCYVRPSHGLKIVPIRPFYKIKLGDHVTLRYEAIFSAWVIDKYMTIIISREKICAY